ncbi:interferon regulatory factor 6-like [Lineus longissimus]|uniref:interferon regulatory factor 6-like n=1 Tax=Lineus longissimus TaxID=88925 RepID=UPI002B4D00EE
MSHHKERKLLLRDWLEVQLDSGRAQGIEWFQKENGLFKMVWRHANNPIWHEEDGWIYREWAIHKDHYKPNSDGIWPEADYPTWKARFRCAVKRCNDIEEVPIQKTSGQAKIEWKMYKLMPKRDRRSVPMFPTFTSTVVGQISDIDFGSPISSQAGDQSTAIVTMGAYSTDIIHTVAFATQSEIDKLPRNIPAVLSGIQGTPPSSMATEVAQQEATFSGGLHNILNQDLLQMSPEMFAECGQALMDVSIGNSIEIDNAGAVCEMPDSVSYMSFKSPPKDHDTCLWLRYKKAVIGKHYIQNEKGCRIYYSNQPNIPQLSEQYVGTNHIGFPSPHFYGKGNLDAMSLENTEKLLSCMDNGLHIYCDNDCNIYATRLSRCRIYYADPAMNAAEPILMPRKQKIKVFDSLKFRQSFAELQSRNGSGPRPSVCVLFAFGEQWSLTKAIDKTLISATLINAQSWHQLSKYLAWIKVQDELAGRGRKENEDIKDLSSEYDKMSFEVESNKS